MAKTKSASEALPDQITSVAADLADIERAAEQLRLQRDQLFVRAYDTRSISVTEMGRLAGLRRESVHEAINRTKRESDGS